MCASVIFFFLGDEIEALREKKTSRGSDLISGRGRIETRLSGP